MSTALRAALLKLNRRSPLPASQFSPSQRQALDQFARQTGAVHCQCQGRGDAYHVRDPQLLTLHLAELSPQPDISGEAELPLRARHLGFARDSKARSHHHACHYLLIKAVGNEVSWHQEQTGPVLQLTQLTRDFGAASLRIEAEDSWHTRQPLWLIENQALFDRTDWLPNDQNATLLYYGGQLDGRLLTWLARRPRASRIMLFPDYDGIGLANVVRLHALLGDDCECWLMPDWHERLTHYGNRKLWQDTFDQFTSAAPRLPDYLHPLTEHMRQNALALEQEAIWLPLPSRLLPG